jgi:hypothetical protein
MWLIRLNGQPGNYFDHLRWRDCGLNLPINHPNQKRPSSFLSRPPIRDVLQFNWDLTLALIRHTRLLVSQGN